jgi:hypothetical protein
MLASGDAPVDFNPARTLLTSRWALGQELLVKRCAESLVYLVVGESYAADGSCKERIVRLPGEGSQYVRWRMAGLRPHAMRGIRDVRPSSSVPMRE